MTECEKDTLYRSETKKNDSRADYRCSDVFVCQCDYRSGDDQAYHVDFVRRFCK